MISLSVNEDVVQENTRKFIAHVKNVKNIQKQTTIMSVVFEFDSWCLAQQNFDQNGILILGVLKSIKKWAKKHQMIFEPFPPCCYKSHISKITRNEPKSVWSVFFFFKTESIFVEILCSWWCGVIYDTSLIM